MIWLPAGSEIDSASTVQKYLNRLESSNHATRHGLLSVSAEHEQRLAPRCIPANGQREPARALVCAGGEQERHRQRIEHGDERQREQADRSLEVGGRCTDQLGKISHRADVGLSTPALGVNLGFVDLQAGERLGFSLARGNDVSAIAALLVSERHRADGPAKPRRCLDGRVDLGNPPIEVGDGLALNGEAGLGVGGSVRERQIHGRHMIEVGAREETEHADRVQAHQHTDHRDED